MSKYTVQLRYLVEQFAADHGTNGIDPKNWPLAYPMLGLSGTVNTLNLPPYPVLSEDDRDRINRKIIQRYWFNEIGQETTGQFAWMLNESMNRIMPYYNQLYKAKIDSLQKLVGEEWGVDRLTELASMSAATNNMSGDIATSDTRNGSGNLNRQHEENNVNRMLDTPQARIENLDDNYLTQASKGDSSSTDSDQNTYDESENSSTKSISTGSSSLKRDDSGTFGEKGKRLSPQHWELALGIGRELLNIDNMIVNDMELRDCFMHIW